MKAIKRGLIGLVLSVGLVLGAGQMAHAWCGYYAPYKGDHVTYYNCQGPYQSGSYNNRPLYYCYADWDWYAEVFWGKHDGPVWVYGYQQCYA